MADSKTDKGSGTPKGSRFKASKFQHLGKYFLFVLLLVIQSFVSYTIVERNYELIYSYTASFFPTESGKYELEQIIVNPANTNGQRYLLVELSLELIDRDDEQLIETNISKIRNNLIEHLSSRSVSQLQGIEKKENIRFQLVSIINNTIGRRSVRNLYYSKYVMQ